MAEIIDSFKESEAESATSGGSTGGTELSLCCDNTPSLENIEVEQVLGVEMQQKVLDVHIHLPPSMAKIGHIIDVYVKNVKVDSVKVLPDKVVIRGTYSVKVMYNGCGEAGEVTFFEKRGLKFTRDIAVEGACPNMKAAADVRVEYMQYDFDQRTRDSVDVTVVLKLWVRVMTKASLSVVALSDADAVGNFDSSIVEGCETDAEVSLGEMTSQAETELKEGTVTGSRVNLRTGPGTNYPSIKKLGRGDTVKILEHAFGWYKVQLLGGADSGWIAGWFVEIKK